MNESDGQRGLADPFHRLVRLVYEAPEKNVGVGNSGRARREVAGARSDRQSYVNFGA